MKEVESTRLDQSGLLNEQVHPDELQELLARLAATEALFSEPVPTIRDVAEATDASPLLIGRILSQMRGPDEVTELKGRMDGFEARLRQLENSKTHEPARVGPCLSHALDDFKTIDFNQLLAESGVGNFSPEISWKEQKRLFDLDLQSDFSWHERDPLHRLGRITIVIIFGMLVSLILISARPACGPPSAGADRPIPFPIERSSR
ncbi:MAG: hypothetical protein QE269_02355 [Fimbriimonas sp.]|nr:hypothetical protein [Fimbriimonas sp.]